MSKACLNIRRRALVEQPSLLTSATLKRCLMSVNAKENMYIHTTEVTIEWQ